MSARDTVHIALFAAIIGALGMLPSVPVPLIPVPITAQTLGVMLAGSILGPKRGALSTLLLIVLVAAGLPALAGGRGGLGVLVGPTVGFLLSWPLAAFVTGWIIERGWTRLNFGYALLGNVAGGIVAVYLVGIPVLALVAGVPLAKAAYGSLLFLPGDLAKAALAAAVLLVIRRGYPALRSAEPKRTA